MYVLDSDTFSHVCRYGQQRLLGRRIAAIPNPKSSLSLTIVTVEEALEGRLKEIRDSRNLGALPAHYLYLQETFNELKKYQILSFTPEANLIYQEIPKNVKKDRAHDCRIAAIAVAFNLTVITMNIKEDFSKIKDALPALRFADWSINTI